MLEAQTVSLGRDFARALDICLFAQDLGLLLTLFRQDYSRRLPAACW